MVDFTDVLSRAVAGKRTYEERRAVYERARQALVNQLRALDPPLPEGDVTRQRLALEESIRKIESEASIQAAAARAAALRRPAEPLRASQPPAPAIGGTFGEEQKAPAPLAAPPPPPLMTPPPTTPEPPFAPPPRPLVAPPPREEQPPMAPAHKEVAAAPPAPPVFAPLKPERIEATPVRGARVTPPEPLFVDPDDEKQIAQALARQAERNKAAAIEFRDHEDAGDPLIAAHQPPLRKLPPGQPAWRRWLMFALILLALILAGAGGILLALRGQGARQTTAVETPTAPPPASAPAKSSERIGQGNAPDAKPPAVSGQSTPQAGGQTAVLYDENAQVANGVDTYKGSVAWRIDTDNGAQGPERVIRGLVDIPQRGIKVLLTIRRNLDQALPASHTVEILFDVPPNFAFGGVESLEQVFMKTGEQANGLPLRGALARITSGYFLIGLSALGPNRENNVALLRERPWIDITFLYRNGRRAVLAVGKGEQGTKIFDEVFSQWGG